MIDLISQILKRRIIRPIFGTAETPPKIFQPTHLHDIHGTVPVGIISGVANAVGRPDLLLPIIAGFGEVDSAEPSHAMWDMGRLVRSNDDLTAEFEKGITGLIDRLLQSESPEASNFKGV